MGRLPTCYAPVRRFTKAPKDLFSHDLHVLSTPPAFVLSQDQTLREKINTCHFSEETIVLNVSYVRIMASKIP